MGGRPTHLREKPWGRGWFAVQVSILSCLCYFFLFFHFFPIFFIPFFLSFFFFLFFFFITPYFILLALSLACPQGLHLEESCEVTWAQHASAKGGGRRGASTLSFAAAPLARALNAGRGSRLAARFTRYKARFPYDRCWRKKKSVIIAIIWKPGLTGELASRLLSRCIAAAKFFIFGNN